MPIFLHILMVIILMVISSDLSAIAGSWAHQLKLPGGQIATFTPIIALSVYILGIALGGFDKKYRCVWALIPLIVVYPALIFNGFSHSITTPKRFTSQDYQQLKSEYGKPMIMVNDKIYVAKADYDPTLTARLRVIAESHQTTTEPDTP